MFSIGTSTNISCRQWRELTHCVALQKCFLKVDKPNKDELSMSLDKTRSALVKHPAAFPELLLTSSVKMNGIETLRTTIANIE